MSNDSHDQLCYLEAGQVTGPCGGLEGVTLSTETDETLGTLDGVVIDPSERRIRYFVVQRRGWLRTHRYLLSADRPAQITKDRRNLRLPVEPGVHRLNDIALADGADLAVRLCHDDVGPQFPEHLRVNAIDRQRVLQRLPHAAVDLGTRALDVEFRLSADGKTLYRLRKVAFMRAADDLLLEAEGTDYLGRAGDEGHNPRHGGTPNN